MAEVIRSRARRTLQHLETHPNDPKALFYLANFQIKGCDDISIDFKNAFKNLKKSAKFGHIVACMRVVQIYLFLDSHFRKIVSVNTAKAKKYIWMAIDHANNMDIDYIYQYPGEKEYCLDQISDLNRLRSYIKAHGPLTQKMKNKYKSTTIVTTSHE